MTPESRPVFGYLSDSPNARMLRGIDLGFGRSAAIWRNASDRVTYDGPRDHTCSYYLRDGTGTRRLNGGPTGGWPVRGWQGAVSIMPDGHYSEWEITSPFEFIHLYVPDGELRRAYAETLDRDARLMALPDLTYQEAPVLTAAFEKLVRATWSDNAVMAGEAAAELVGTVFDDLGTRGRGQRRLRGGLSPHVQRRVLDYIEANLEGTLRLPELAGVAQLSEFHFQRCFRAQYGVSPHVWIGHRRIERARAMLRARQPLAQIALACGFSSQSHLTRAFKAATGVTPAAYRALL